jgi:hypothetical protein
MRRKMVTVSGKVVRSVEELDGKEALFINTVLAMSPVMTRA